MPRRYIPNMDRQIVDIVFVAEEALAGTDPDAEIPYTDWRGIKGYAYRHALCLNQDEAYRRLSRSNDTFKLAGLQA